jgi:transposase-like protein
MRAPVLAVEDGALGSWGAPREVFPDKREQRCWFHKIGTYCQRCQSLRILAR